MFFIYLLGKSANGKGEWLCGWRAVEKLKSRDMETEYEKKYAVREFIPKDHNPLPWRVEECMVWHRVVSSEGKVVCNCRNIKDAELIVRCVNK